MQKKAEMKRKARYDRVISLTNTFILHVQFNTLPKYNPLIDPLVIQAPTHKKPQPQVTHF